MEKDKYKSVYKSEAEIPAELKALDGLFVSRNGQMEFDFQGFTDLDALANPGLAANRDKIKGEKTTTEEALADEKRARKQAEDELAKVQKPGTKIVSEKEVEQLKEYQKLGTPIDIDAKLKENSELKGNAEKTKRDEDIKILCEETGLNHEAVIDLLETRLKDGKLISKTGKVPDPKNPKKDIDGKIAYVEITKNVDGKEKLEEYKFTDFVKDQKYPDYVVQGLFNAAKPKNTANTKNDDVNIPDLSTGRVKDDNSGDGNKSRVTKRVEQQRQENSTRPKPWLKTATEEK